jgi:hypothetical protein
MSVPSSSSPASDDREEEKTTGALVGGRERGVGYIRENRKQAAWRQLQV